MPRSFPHGMVGRVLFESQSGDPPPGLRILNLFPPPLCGLVCVLAFYSIPFQYYSVSRVFLLLAGVPAGDLAVPRMFFSVLR